MAKPNLVQNLQHVLNNVQPGETVESYAIALNLGMPASQVGLAIYRDGRFQKVTGETKKLVWQKKPEPPQKKPRPRNITHDHEQIRIQFLVDIDLTRDPAMGDREYDRYQFQEGMTYVCTWGWARHLFTKGQAKRIPMVAPVDSPEPRPAYDPAPKSLKPLAQAYLAKYDFAPELQ